MQALCICKSLPPPPPPPDFSFPTHHLVKKLLCVFFIDIWGGGRYFRKDLLNPYTLFYR